MQKTSEHAENIRGKSKASADKPAGKQRKIKGQPTESSRHIRRTSDDNQKKRKTILRQSYENQKNIRRTSE